MRESPQQDNINASFVKPLTVTQTLSMGFKKEDGVGGDVKLFWKISSPLESLRAYKIRSLVIVKS
jgi:hypothetical protein